MLARHDEGLPGGLGRNGGSVERSTDRRAANPVRFTSNVAGSLILLTDVACFLISAPIALLAFEVLRGARVLAAVHVFAFVLMLVSFLLIRSSRQAYSRSMLDPGDLYSEATLEAVVSSLVASALVWQVGLVEGYSRGLAILFLLSVVACLWLSRPLLRRTIRLLADRGRIEQRIVFYGADPDSISVTRRLIESLDFPHLRFVGVADDRPSAFEFDDLPMIGDLAKLCEIARLGQVDQVLISSSNLSPERLAEIVEGMSEVCVDVSLIPTQALDLAPNYRVNLLGSMPVLTLWQRPFRDFNRIVKRVEDAVLSSFALLVLAPILLVTALLVRLTSPGPILFIQPRMGFNNEVIHVFKFRTMYSHLTDIGAVKTTTRGDPRITPVGRIMRKFSIDELPQLFNVLQGSMSLVGPRPHAMEMKVGDRYYHEAVRGYAGRHRVKPGITGLAQVKGLRGEVRTIERAKRRIELDKHYVDHWSLWLDLWILMATAKAVLFDRDAY